jgi:hypothetical protein
MKLKYIYISLLSLIIIPFSLSSQTHKLAGQIIDSESGVGLPYTNIMVLNNSIGTTSNINGYFELDLDDSYKDDSLVISYMGYNTLIVSINQIGQNPIKLLQQPYEINEVVVKASGKKVKDIYINKFRKNKCMLRYSRSPFDSIGTVLIPYRPKEPTIEALYIPYIEDYERMKIKEILLYVCNLKDSSYFRLRIYNSTESGIPDKDLLITPLNIKVSERNQLLKINLEEYNFTIPKQGIFIGFELLIIPENLTTIKNNLGKTAIVYSPFLYQIPSKTIGDYWIFSKGKWSCSKFWYFNDGMWFMSDKSDIKDKETSDARMYKPAINVVLTK